MSPTVDAASLAREAEALLMAIAGRPGAVDELTGPGQPTLAARMP